MEAGMQQQEGSVSDSSVKREEKSISLTYETLYEFARIERNKEELNELPKAFFAQTLSYLKEKEALLASFAHKTDLFSAAERDKLATQLKNIRRIITDLYHRRERKLLIMAVNKARMSAAVVDTSKMLVEEKRLFEQLVTLLKGYKEGLLHSLLQLKDPYVSPYLSFDGPKSSGVKKELGGGVSSGVGGVSTSVASGGSSVSMGSSGSVSSGVGGVGSSVSAGGSSGVGQSSVAAEVSEGSSESEPEMVNLKITAPVAKFVGADLSILGPFSPGDMVSIPQNVAKILLSQGKAEKVGE